MRASIENTQWLGGQKLRSVGYRAVSFFSSFVLAFGILFVPFMRAAAESYGISYVVGQNDYTSSFNDNLDEDSGANATGLNRPWAVAIDGSHHRMFVADRNNNRVLVFNLDGDNQLVDKTADKVLGQLGMEASECNLGASRAQNSLCEPDALAYDPALDRLFVTDSENSRVMVFDTASITNGENAVNVLGQPDFVTEDCCTAAANRLASPHAIAYDTAGHRLFVGDDNNRVVIFDLNAITDGEAALDVFGQGDLTSDDYHCDSPDSSVTGDGLCGGPGGLVFDPVDNRLFVSDRQNYRVLVFNAGAESLTGIAADHVIGRPNMTAGGLVTATAATILDPRAMAYDTDSGRLFVTDAGYAGGSRVLVFDASVTGLDEGGDGPDAQLVLGQPDFTSSDPNQGNPDPDANTLYGPYGVAYDSTTAHLYVADSINNRVLTYDANSEVLATNDDAIDVLGQVDFQHDPANGLVAPNPNGFSFPGSTAVDTVHHRLFVADFQNERVVVYELDGDNQLDDNVADWVLGQESLYADNDSAGCDSDLVSASTLCFGEGIFGGLAYDSVNDQLFVSDGNAHRVMIFDTATITNGEDAVMQIGQNSFASSAACNRDGSVGNNTFCYLGNLALDALNHRLFVADQNNNRVMVFDLDSNNLPTDDVADAVFGQPGFDTNNCNQGGATTSSTLCSPYGVTLDTVNHHLYVADPGNSRVVMYNLDSDNSVSDTTADYLLGQEAYNGDSCNIDNGPPSDVSMCNAFSVSMDTAGHRLFVADSGNNRVLVYGLDDDNVPVDAVADAVIGQPDFETTDADTTADKFSYPYGVTYNTATQQLYVADSGNNRVMVFLAASTSTPDIDSDGDGRADEMEDEGPNGGDANNDGIQDSEQSNVATFESEVTDKFVTLEVDDECIITDAGLNAETSNATPDAGYSYPEGLMNFTIMCGTPGFTATVKQYYHNIDLPHFVLRKYDPDTESYLTIEDAHIQSNESDALTAVSATYQITDGGSLDQDDSANGTIVDPAGLAEQTIGVPDTGVGGLAR